jgi:hypothetical protein
MQMEDMALSLEGDPCKAVKSIGEKHAYQHERTG